MADAVQKSIKSRRNIVSDMTKEREAVVDDFDSSSMQLDTSEVSLGDTQEQYSPPTPPEPEKRPKMPDKAKSVKKSKTKTIAELRQQLHDCKSALVEIKENASLKYLKLKMDYDELNESNMKLKDLKNELERKLSSAVGADRVDWINQLESSQATLQAELDQTKSELDAAKKETDDVKSRCCSSCLNKINLVPEASKPAATAAPRARSLWSLFQLDEEARATTEAASTVATMCGSGNITTDAHHPLPAKIFLEQKGFASPSMNTNFIERGPDDTLDESSRANTDDLEADLEAIEQKMKDDIENMSREWKRPSKKRVHNHSVRRDMARHKRNNASKTKSARGTLDSFFSESLSQSIRDLGAEEMDEEQSFYSLQRSVGSSSPEKDTEKKKLDERSVLPGQKETPLPTKTTGSANSSPSSQEGTSRVFGQDTDAVEVTEEGPLSVEADAISVATAPASSRGVDRRGLMSKAFSLRDSLRSLSEEVEDEAVSSKAFDRRLENLRAKSLRADFIQENPRKKTPPKSTLRSSHSVSGSKAVHWEDPSKKDDEAKLKARKEVEVWAAVDLAPITALSV